MKNAVMYPFERNRYFAGKMLTSADFDAEQSYLNGKRRFVNNLMFGGGVVCGLGVFSLDDLSLMIESGVAMDESGREIVVDTSQVKKLSAIEGFDRISSEEAILCIRYDETDIHTVYAVNGGKDGKDFEYNRISEGYRFFLADAGEGEGALEMETEFLTTGILYSDQDFSIETAIPATVSRGRNVRMLVRVRGLSGTGKRLAYHATLQVPGFILPGGGHEIQISIEDLRLGEGEVHEIPFWMYCREASAVDTMVILNGSTAKLFIDDVAVPADRPFSMRVMFSELSPVELVSREIGRVSLELKQAMGIREFIPLAKLRLVRTENAYIIEEVVETGVKNYIAAPSHDHLRNVYMEYFQKDVDILHTGSSEKTAPVGVTAATNDSLSDRIATGVLEIPLGENAGKGDIRYSGEIVHGLGKGNVYVQIGYEFFAEDQSLGANSKSTVYGNPDLFKGQLRARVDAETAVKVLNDKGSFVVAARLADRADQLVLTYRWVAIKFPAGNDLGLVDNYDGKSISAETPTVVLGTKESHFFGVIFNNMDSASITYELTESGSGEITSDGVYTAPSREGVYEIRIYCTDMPVICTYAYAIVKKKEYLEEAAGANPEN